MRLSIQGPFFAFCFLLSSFLPVWAQSEAQSTGDFVEFQNIRNPRKIVEIHRGTTIEFPIPKGQKIRGVVEDITDSSLVVTTRDSRRIDINLDKTPYINAIKTKRRKVGAGFLIAAGSITFIFLIIGSVLLASVGFAGIGGGIGLLILVIALLYGLFNPLSLLLIGLGLILFFSAKKRLEKGKWARKRKRRVFIRK